jgi:hypothetical protein
MTLMDQTSAIYALPLGLLLIAWSVISAMLIAALAAALGQARMDANHKEHLLATYFGARRAADAEAAADAEFERDAA